MAKSAQQEKMAVAFHTDAMGRMALMGVNPAAHLIRDLLGPQMPVRD